MLWILRVFKEVEDMPGSFYKVVIDRVAGTQLGSATPQMAWAWNGGAKVSF